MSNPFRRFVPRMAWQWEDDSSWRAVDGSLLFVDISGFTALSEKLAARGRIGAEELTSVLGRVFGAMLEAVYARGGSMLKFGGDALLLLFDSEDHAMQATAAAVEMRAALREAAKQPTSVGRIALRMSSGVATGPVDLFLVGNSHRELIVGGPTTSKVNLMEGTADASEIVVSPETAALLPSGFVGDSKGEGLLLRKRVVDHPTPDSGATAEEVIPPEALVPLGLREVIGSGVADSEHRVASIGFIGYKGTDTTLARSGPVAAAQALEQLVAAVQESVDDEGVTFLASDVAGDGGKIILAAGVPTGRGDDEGRILRAARRILDSEQSLDVRIGVNRGHVFSGAVGIQRRATYTVMGDTVNLAARLMTAAPYGALYANPSVLDRSSTLFRTKALEKFQVKGKAEAVEAYEVGDETGHRTRETTRDLVFTGRDTELARLDELISSGGSTVTIDGDSGIGKTRLISEAMALHPDLPTIVAQGEPARFESPYWAFRDPLRTLIGVDPGPQPEMRSAVTDAITRRAPDLLPMLPLLGDATQIDIADTPETADLDARFRPTKTAETVSALLEGLIDGPAVVVVEDAHWMDELSVGLVSHLSGQASERGWTVLVTSHGTDSEALGERMNLGPLNEAAVREIAIAATEAAPLRPHELDAIVARAGGNPLFLGEILRVVRETGQAADLPDSLEAVVSADIDTLPPLTRQILRYAAVLGRSFPTIVFDRVLGPEGVGIDQATQAELSRFIEPQEPDRMHFRLSVVHSAAYRGLSFRRRQELHARAGEVIEELAGDDTESAADVLSYHFSNSGNHEKTWHYARVAAGRAKRAYANAQAAAHYESAIDSARHVDHVGADQLALIWADLGDVRDLAGEYEAARTAFAQALRVDDLDEVVAADLYLKRSEMWYLSGELGNAKRNLTLGRSRLRHRSDVDAERARSRLDAFRSSISARAGDPVGAAEAALRAIEVASGVGEKKALARAYGVLDWANFMMGIDEPRRSQEAIEIWKSVGQLERAVTLMSNLGAFAYLEGDWNGAVDWYKKSIEAAERTGHVAEDGAANTMANLAEVLVSQRRFDEAVPLIEESARVFIASNVPQALPFVQLQEARAAVGRGDVDKAIEILEPMLAEQLKSGNLDEAPDTAVHLAHALIAAGRPAEAMDRIDLLQLEAENDLEEVPPSIARTRGLALLEAGQGEDANRYFELALEQARAQGDLFEEAQVLDIMGEADPDRRDELFRALGIRRPTT